MQLTRAGEYAIRCILYLSRHEGQVVLLDAICKDQDSPRYLSAKVLQTMVRTGIVKSSRGTGGGYSLARSASSISLLNVIEAIEGPICLNYCTKSSSECSRDSGCPVHPVWSEAQDSLRDLLASYTFDQLAKQ